jgi:hypothetical protein
MEQGNWLFWLSGLKMSYCGTFAPPLSVDLIPLINPFWYIFIYILSLLSFQKRMYKPYCLWSFVLLKCDPRYITFKL